MKLTTTQNETLLRAGDPVGDSPDLRGTFIVFSACPHWIRNPKGRRRMTGRGAESAKRTITTRERVELVALLRKAGQYFEVSAELPRVKRLAFARSLARQLAEMASVWCEHRYVVGDPASPAGRCEDCGAVVFTLMGDT